MGIFAQGGDDPGEIPFADGLHVPDLLPAPDLEAITRKPSIAAQALWYIACQQYMLANARSQL